MVIKCSSTPSNFSPQPLLQDFIHLNPLPIFILDSLHIIRLASDQAHLLFGPILGQHISSIYHQTGHPIEHGCHRARQRLISFRSSIQDIPLHHRFQPTTVQVSLAGLHSSAIQATGLPTMPHLVQIDAFEALPGSQEYWYHCCLRARDSSVISDRDEFINRMCHTVFDCPVPWPMHALSLDRSVSIANPAGCELFQCLNPIEEHPTGTFNFNPWRLFDPCFENELPTSEFPVARSLRGEIITAQEYGCILPDKSRRVMTIGAKPIRKDPLKHYPSGSTQDILGGLIYVRDVTDERERTREAEREKARLKAEAIAAEEANQTKSAFLSNMSVSLVLLTRVSHHLQPSV